MCVKQKAWAENCFQHAMVKGSISGKGSKLPIH